MIYENDLTARLLLVGRFSFFSLDNSGDLWYDYLCYILYKDYERDSSAGETLPQRVGDGVSPTEYRCVKITRELPAEWRLPLSADGSPPLMGGRMMVRANRWYSEVVLSSCFAGRGIFYFSEVFGDVQKSIDQYELCTA